MSCSITFTVATLVERLAQYFPVLIDVPCWPIYLLQRSMYRVQTRAVVAVETTLMFDPLVLCLLPLTNIESFVLSRAYKTYRSCATSPRHVVSKV